MGYSWLTIHRVRFTNPRDAREDGSPSGPRAAAAWRFGPDAALGEDGLRSGVSDIWGGIGFYKDRATAEAVFTDPAEHLDFLGDTTENWHALAGIISHRGRKDWSTATEPSPDLHPLDTDPGGTLAVVTSAGYEPGDGTLDPRVKPFLKKVNSVVDHYRTLDGNLAACLFNATNWKFGLTFSIWDNERAMMTAAYREGTHAAYLKEHQASPMFDFSSFTRLRILRTAGTWDGKNPVPAAA